VDGAPNSFCDDAPTCAEPLRLCSDHTRWGATWRRLLAETKGDDGAPSGGDRPRAMHCVAPDNDEDEDVNMRVAREDDYVRDPNGSRRHIMPDVSGRHGS
jgi:hypothetical protein